MKKLLLVGFIFSVGFATAQSIKLKNKDNSAVVTNTSQSVSGPVTATEINFNIEIENASTSQIVVRAKRLELVSVNGTKNGFCFGFTCNEYTSGSTPIANMPQDSLILAPGAKDGLTKLQHIPQNVQGTATYRGVFWVSGNPTDSAYVDVTFSTWATGIETNKTESNFVEAYPNPAQNTINIAYNSLNPQNTSIAVYNVLGEKVREITKLNKDGVSSVDLSSLEAGVYFYSMIVNNKTVITKKFMVTK